MTSKVTLASLKRGEPCDNVSFVEVEVQKILSESSYIVADEKDHFILDMSENPQQTTCMSIGKCFRLLFPSLKEGILKFGSKYKPGPIKPFPAAKLTAAIIKRCTPKAIDPTDLKLLREVCDVTKDTPIPILYLKVVFVGEDKMASYSLSRRSISPPEFLLSCQHHHHYQIYIFQVVWYARMYALT